MTAYNPLHPNGICVLMQGYYKHVRPQFAQVTRYNYADQGADY
jgi:hypothetical protein